MTNKLTDTQRVLLSHAAMQIDGVVLPPPKSVRLNAGALTTVLRRLLHQGLAIERVATRDQVAWRQGVEGERQALVISEEGCLAIGVEPIGTGAARETVHLQMQGAEDVLPPTPEHPSAGAPATLYPRAGTKLAALAHALCRPGGATLEDLMIATGWQAHSVRGAISGALKKTFEMEVTSSKIEGRGRVYAIAADDAA